MKTLLGMAMATLLAAPAFAGAELPTPPVEISEPATLAILAAGVGALAIAKFRKRK